MAAPPQPVITAPVGSTNLGCNPATLPDDAAVLALFWNDATCTLLSTIALHGDGGTACASNRTFSVVVTDACQNKATNTLVYNWTADTTPPVITAPVGATNLGCNPATLPDDAAVLALVRASDNCALLSTNVTHGDGGTACASNRTFSVVVTDACQNKATNTLVYNWTADTTPPVITAPLGTTNLGCNPATLPDDAAVLALVRASDNCALLATNVTHGDGGTACASNRTFSVVVTDACQNKATNTLVYN